MKRSGKRKRLAIERRVVAVSTSLPRLSPKESARAKAKIQIQAQRRKKKIPLIHPGEKTRAARRRRKFFRKGSRTRTKTGRGSVRASTQENPRMSATTTTTASSIPNHAKPKATRVKPRATRRLRVAWFSERGAIRLAPK